MNSDYNKNYQFYLDIVEKELETTFAKLQKEPSVLYDAMRYAVMGGGKRVRPVLCLATSQMLGVDIDKAKKFAIALEFIHSYSLVHDDLPAMDNDDYRRGKFSTHKKFGEAYGILAGDALLNTAFEICLSINDFSFKEAKAMKVLAEYAGYSGMIAGQVLDLQNEHNESATEKELYDVYINKTSKLLTAPLLMASCLADNKYYEELRQFGFNLGVMFQITDDIMDVEGTVELIGKTPNKDAEEGKLTSVKIYGLQGAKEKNKKLYSECVKILSGLDNNQFLLDFTESMYRRNK